jgi:hypothetical protein
MPDVILFPFIPQAFKYIVNKFFRLFLGPGLVVRPFRCLAEANPPAVRQ